jgi:hypothetical protein
MQFSWIMINVVTFQDPNRTKATVTRKLLARKRLKAYNKRKEKHEKKEVMKFIEVLSSLTPQEEEVAMGMHRTKRREFKAHSPLTSAQKWIGESSPSTNLPRFQVQ